MYNISVEIDEKLASGDKLSDIWCTTPEINRFTYPFPPTRLHLLFGVKFQAIKFLIKWQPGILLIKISLEYKVLMLQYMQSGNNGNHSN